jgi:ketosteroid isomerase-like protein
VKFRVPVLGALLALAGWGCASTTLESYDPKSQDEAQVVSMLRRIPNGIKVRSLDLIMQPYAEDVFIGNFQRYLGVAAPTAPQAISKADLRLAYAQLFRAARDFSMDVKDVQLTLSGDRAVVEARTELLLKFEAGRKERKQEVFVNDVTWRLRRTPAGWKIVEEIWR